MRPTRRWWTIVGAGSVLLLVAILGEQPLALAGAASLGAFCLASAVRSAAVFVRTRNALSVDVDAIPSSVVVNGDTMLSVTASLASPAPRPVVVDCTAPPGVRGDSLQVVLDPGETHSSGRTQYIFPVGGQFDLPNVICRVEGPDGLFTQSFRIDEQTSVTAEPNALEDIYVSAGGEQVAVLSEVSVGKTSSPELGNIDSVRQYLPGDAIRLMDWKATARLGEPHVRDFEVDDGASTHIVVDARSRLRVGDAGRRKIDFVRQAALAFARRIKEKGDPLGLTIVDDSGPRLSTGTMPSVGQYHRIREELMSLGGDGGGSPGPSSMSVDTGRTQAGLAYNRLSARSEPLTPFVTTLRPFFHRTGSYLERLSADPLFDAVHRHSMEQPAGAWTVLFTDDEDRASVEEAARIATRRNSRVTVFLTPSALFDRSGLLDLETAYEQLVAFEEFRSRLGRIPRVAAFEVAPGERVRAVRTRGRDPNPGRSESGHSS
jgi:uncharacterized protein (DUF58 family)